MAVFDMNGDHELAELRAQFRRLEEKYLTSNRQLEERIEECARLRADAEELVEALTLMVGGSVHGGAYDEGKAMAALARWQSKHGVKR